MGIGIEQIFGKLGGFFSTNVNPLALDAIDWKYMAAYCGWIAFEFGFVFTFYPETHGRTLEELAFCMLHLTMLQLTIANSENSVRRQRARR